MCGASLILLSIWFAAEAPARLRTWSDETGKFRIEAELLEVTNNEVRLRKADGRVVTVPINKLSAADQMNLAVQAKKPVNNSPASQSATTKVASEDSASAFRTWTDSSGQRMEAKFRGSSSGLIRLQLKENGREVQLGMSKLSKEDQDWIKARAEKAQQTARTNAEAQGTRTPLREPPINVESSARRESASRKAAYIVLPEDFWDRVWAGEIDPRFLDREKGKDVLITEMRALLTRRDVSVRNAIKKGAEPQTAAASATQAVFPDVVQFLIDKGERPTDAIIKSATLLVKYFDGSETAQRSSNARQAELRDVRLREMSQLLPIAFLNNMTQKYRQAIGAR